jgi:outer membrane receptor protein involved in Fe transport
MRIVRGAAFGTALFVVTETGAAATEAEERTGSEEAATVAQVSHDAAAKPAPVKRRERLAEVLVEADRPLSAASSLNIRAQDYAMRPHATIQEVLNNVPGLVVTQHQGGGKATQYLIRGFDSDHGTDIAVSVDGLPVNMVSHGHGQGYADLNFVIPETVERISLFKGPYFVEFGDFATAGALQFNLVDEFEENFFHTEFGSFDTLRLVGGVSPRLGEVRTAIAAQAYLSNGPFIDPQDFSRFNAFARFSLDPTPDSTVRVWGSAMVSEWGASGQVPLRQVLEGDLSPFGSLDNSEGGKTDREDLVLEYEFRPSAEDTVRAMAYATHYALNLYSNFTFFQETGLRFARLPDGSVVDTGDDAVLPGADYIPGDGIRQTDDRMMYGVQLDYTRDWEALGVPMQTRIGLQNRNDNIGVTLSRQVRRAVFHDINDARIYENSLGLFLGQQVFPADWIRLEVGLRGNLFFFDVANRLRPQGTDPNYTSISIAGKSNDSIVSPKANLVLTPVEDTDVYFNFGTGFHSNDARSTAANTINSADPETFVPSQEDGFSPLTRAIGYELGSRTRQFGRLDLAAALWLLDLDNELVFCGDCGTLDPVGGITRRWGIDFEARYRITDWLFADYDLTWDDPRVLATGEAVPLAPTLMMNGGITVEPFEGFQAALRVRYLDDYPANEDRTLTTRGYALLDLMARYRWRNLEVGLAFLNLTDASWREAQFGYPSCVRGEVGASPACLAKPGPEPGEGVDDINFTPGNPFAVRAGLTVFF